MSEPADDRGGARTPTTYWDYIKVEELLGLQGGLPGDEAALGNDEVLFIVVHQIDELWFKLALRELVAARDLLDQNPVPETALAGTVRSLRRLTAIMEHAAAHFGLMETMTTRDYLGFRDKLMPASGFQSAQLREIEILLGLREDDRIRFGHESSYRAALRGPGGRPSPASQRVDRRLGDGRPTMHGALRSWLERTPIEGSTPADPGDADTVDAFIAAYLSTWDQEADRQEALARAHALTPEDVDRLKGKYDAQRSAARRFLQVEDLDDASPEERARTRRIRAALLFVESYRELPLLSWPRELLDAVVAFEQSFLVFRQRHARMVERMIGRRPGTGGSAGVDYLDQTALAYRVFKELWQVRALLIRREALPPLRRADFYGFVAEHG
jgi:tryptophan 2,3-dioxygenase